MPLRRRIPFALPAAALLWGCSSLLWGCSSRDAVEDASPPLAAAVTAIPRAAPGAQGAQFNSSAAARPTGRTDPRLHRPEPPDDPFGDLEVPHGKKPPAAPEPPDQDDADGGAPAAKPKQKGVSL